MKQKNVILHLACNSILHVITKTCLLCVISEWLYPSMRMNYTTVPCHCCWQIDFTCFNLSPSWKMIVSFSTVLVSVHLAISIFISLKYRWMMLQGTLCLFSLPWYMIQGCRNERHDTLWGYCSKVTHVPLALWWIWDSFQSWSTNLFHSFKATVTSFF